MIVNMRDKWAAQHREVHFFRYNHDRYTSRCYEDVFITEDDRLIYANAERFGEAGFMVCAHVYNVTEQEAIEDTLYPDVFLRDELTGADIVWLSELKPAHDSAARAIIAMEYALNESGNECTDKEFDELYDIALGIIGESIAANTYWGHLFIM